MKPEEELVLISLCLAMVDLIDCFNPAPFKTGDSLAAAMKLHQKKILEAVASANEILLIAKNLLEKGEPPDDLRH